MARSGMRGPPLLLTLFGAVLVAAGCGSAESAPPASPFPPRPESIDVSRLDPCSGMPPAEAERLDLDSGQSGTATVNGTVSPSCTWLGYGSETYIYGAQVIPLNAAGAAAEPGSRIVDIDGFGAVQGAPGTNNGPSQPAFCQIAVDVADGQTFRIQLNSGDPTDGGDPATIDDVCSEARRFASEYLAALRR